MIFEKTEHRAVMIVMLSTTNNAGMLDVQAYYSYC